jgi:biotin transporter BioY
MVEGFAMVTTGGLIGFLTGPSVIGFISEKVNLSAGLSLLILLMIAAAIVAWKNRFLGGAQIVSSEQTTELQYDEQIY